MATLQFGGYVSSIDMHRTVSISGIAMGAAIGLASGILLGYLVLFWVRFMSLPWPGPSLDGLPVSLWFVPLVLTTTVLGVSYYARES
jgi:hypothetical protein